MPSYNLPSFKPLKPAASQIKMQSKRRSHQRTLSLSLPTRHRPPPIQINIAPMDLPTSVIVLPEAGKPQQTQRISSTRSEKAHHARRRSATIRLSTGAWVSGREHHRSPLSPGVDTTFPAADNCRPPSSRYVRPPSLNNSVSVQRISLPRGLSLDELVFIDNPEERRIARSKRNLLFEELVSRSLHRRLNDKVSRCRGERAGLGLNGGREMLIYAALCSSAKSREKALMREGPASAPAERLVFSTETSPLQQDPPSSVRLARALGHRKAMSSVSAMRPVAPPARPILPEKSSSLSGFMDIRKLVGSSALLREDRKPEVIEISMDKQDVKQALDQRLAMSTAKENRPFPTIGSSSKPLPENQPSTPSKHTYSVSITSARHFLSSKLSIDTEPRSPTLTTLLSSIQKTADALTQHFDDSKPVVIPQPSHPVIRLEFDLPSLPPPVAHSKLSAGTERSTKPTSTGWRFKYPCDSIPIKHLPRVRVFNHREQVFALGIPPVA